MINPPTPELTGDSHVTSATKRATPTLIQPISDLVIICFISYLGYRCLAAWQIAGIPLDTYTRVMLTVGTMRVMLTVGTIGQLFILFRCITGFKRWFDFRKKA